MGIKRYVNEVTYKGRNAALTIGYKKNQLQPEAGWRTDFSGPGSAEERAVILFSRSYGKILSI